ncbi:MAG TPA: acetate/propionate family kinase [Pseudomonadota bacterium]|nr:acetate/propionate family kinase [Pseudomonadota bacterium]
MQGPILVVNAGSSSIKFSGYAAMDKQEPILLLKGQIEGIGLAPHMTAKDANGATIAEKVWPRDAKVDHEALFDHLGGWIPEHLGGRTPVGVGHRVVHGGTAFAAATRIDEAVLATLQSLCPLAPLHQPHHLAAIRAIAAVAPSLQQVACFDTAFHHDQPPVAQRFALPRELHEAGIRRYGFHGLSYDYIASALRERAPAVARGRVVAAHLGAGASLCAMRDGKSVDSTMGFTALDGLPMGTRCGALDPGVILYLLQECAMNADAIEKLLYRQSGLLGVSGLSSDMRELLASDDPRAKEAVDLFVYRIAREVGALTATLGGLEGLVFTAGIGEHAAEIRRRVCERCGWLGLVLDLAANERGAECISAAASRVGVWVIATDEERTIARQTIKVLETEGVTHSPSAAAA